jgi:TusA-related sulfurtransferase
MGTLKAKNQDPARDALLEFYPEGSDTASTCALLTPMIKSKLGELRSGQVLEVRVNDPLARGDVEAWSRLSGNAVLKMVDNEGPILRFFVKKK